MMFISWFETAQARLLTMRSSHDAALHPEEQRAPGSALALSGARRLEGFAANAPLNTILRGSQELAPQDDGFGAHPTRKSAPTS
jgi:hypothetical protein